MASTPTQLEAHADQDDISIEERARTMGWKPFDEYRGDPARWKEAALFVADGEEELPILRDRIRRLSEKDVKRDREFENLRATADELKAGIQDAMRLARTADERGYQRGLAELEAKAREAAEGGDIETYDQVNKEIKAAQRERAVVAEELPPAPTPPAPNTQEMAPETKAFLAANPWFTTDMMLRQTMIGAHIEVQAEGTITDLAAQYAEAKRRVVEAFPARFPSARQEQEVPEATPRPQPRFTGNRTLDPSGTQPRRTSASSFNRIENPSERAEAIAAFERMKRGDPDFTEAEYMQLYTGEVTNPLDLIQQRKKA